MGLTFGYLYDFRNPEPWRRPWHEVYRETLDVVAWSETVGFAGAWVPEHHGAEDGYLPTPNLALAAMATRTSNIRIGAAVAIAPLYHPVRFAEECAVLDILSDGRLETALAIGYRRREYDMQGKRFTDRGDHLDEFLHIVRALWAGETVTFAGRHYTVNEARIMPPPRGRIPLYVGGFTDRALDRVAAYADGYLGNEEICDLYLEKLRQRGKDLDRAAIRIPGIFVTVAEDPEQAMEELAPYYHHVFSSYRVWMNEDNAIGMENASLQLAMDVDGFKRSGILQIMTPEQAVGHFKAMQDRIPLEHFMMMRPPGLPAERFVEYAQLFADKVIPAFN
ncbi:LLM class flavin-dependent oxidoreductase [Mycolicibacterium holsaticum]|uniref:LLM class flavin-dependent oxidoreductase n=1 Tax=Mycolicibacterium holsaticum TaxID=152142 RepID=UPI001C7CE2CB|nr:LLM class flavin-dependent oxidoreductase [Mycolicibacterium holsaticum]MDA4106820.1 luciferase [Mycolicibacterium holsaticum DSM 44478 = JCM 12374]QZA14061.1 LLM class flavin-dependent oxidoreductase [Mycolicibacterium holsaticum DSM 44478 = JCM 12374]UNC08480.1 LLM class flavin-dependent oxidoreductase [Mycolicibacterium holsaticum DSM 44478 = JCM 12374]